ncbi:MAG: N-formylglutamate amidohydrolase, partial [Pseudomonadota bacterium]
RNARWVITCDHATNTVPDFVRDGDLGLAPEDMRRHIAYDIGAKGLAMQLGDLLDAPVIGANFSRLVIDPNRGEDDPTLIMRLYDGSLIPGNRHIGPSDIAARLEQCYRPYHDALTDLADRDGAVLVSIHSFTRQLKGRPRRPWDVGVLYAADDRLARPFLSALADCHSMTVGDNEPYRGDLRGDAMDRHGLQPGRPHVLIEVCNDLIETEDAQARWAHTLAPRLEQALEAACV